MKVETVEDLVTPEPFINLGNQIVVLMGPEGSGKTTIGKRLARESDKQFLSVSSILRDIAAKDQGINGDAARNMFASEDYFIDRQILLDIYSDTFSREDLAGGFILDGAFRDVAETKGFQAALEKANRVMPVTSIFLRIPGWMSIDRLSTNPDARGRNDTVESVLDRLSHFYDHLGERASLLEKHENWRFIHVDATRSLEETYDQVRASLR
jgi:adenylate kinase family enzyme